MVEFEEDYNVDAYDDDLFGASNEDYCNCQATSPWPPPELPQYIWPSSNSSFKGNPGHFVRQHGRGGRQRYDDKFVADMKLGNNQETLSHKCPPFQEPCELACFSRTADGSVYFDDRCLRRFRHGVFQEIGANLNVGFETFNEKVEDPENGGFGDLLDCLRDKSIPLENIHFVTFRNNLNKIMGTAYNRLDPWEMGVHKRRGTVYLDVHKLQEEPLDERRRRMMYWGYSFEQLATEHDEEPECVDANVEFCALIKTKLGAHRIIMGAEMDCYDISREGKRHYVELKTSRQLDSRTVERFKKDKLLKFWIQSFIAGVPKIVCAFRDDNGNVVQTEVMRTREIAAKAKERNLWQGAVCLAFADQVLCWLYGSVKENEDYLLRYCPQSDKLELRKADFCPQSISNHVNELI